MPMRELKDHVVEDSAPSTGLKIAAADEPGQGGANHAYVVSGFNTDHNPSAVYGDIDPGQTSLSVIFQNGPIREHGLNGVTQEALLAIVIDRLRSFQSGPFGCPENGTALNHCEQALGVLKERTANRIKRGVEGKNIK
jgi:hypothetical protein